MAKKKQVEQVEGQENAAATEPVAPTTVTLSEICKEMGIKPQSARIKLRKKLAGSKEPGFRWTFPVDQKAEIVALLTPAPKAAKAEKEADAGEGEAGEGEGEGEGETSEDNDD